MLPNGDPLPDGQIPCEDCTGTRSVSCEDCDGEGHRTVECDRGYEHTEDCESCDEGLVDCGNCDGTGFVLDPDLRTDEGL